jgi:hypothetical protein
MNTYITDCSMKITIDRNKQIATIQAEFNHTFPYLKLEFFSKSHGVGEASAKQNLVSSNKKLEDFVGFQNNKRELIITSAMTVKDLEQNFRDAYGLSVQVFRKSGKVWLETTVTDGWTLEEQNIQGEELSK